MDESRKRTLRKDRRFMCETLDFDDIKDELISKEVITPRRKDDIDAEKGPSRKIGALLDYLETQTNDHFDKFLQTCAEDYPHVTQKLFETWNKVKEEEKLGSPKSGIQEEEYLSTLPMELRSGIVTEPFLTLVAQKLGNKWEHLARILGWQQYELDQFRAKSPYDICSQACTMLIEWYYWKAEKATVEALVSACKKVGIPENVYRSAVEDEKKALMEHQEISLL